jgi:hypothetical protein
MAILGFRFSGPLSFWFARRRRQGRVNLASIYRAECFPRLVFFLTSFVERDLVSGAVPVGA